MFLKNACSCSKQKHWDLYIDTAELHAQPEVSQLTSHMSMCAHVMHVSSRYNVSLRAHKSGIGARRAPQRALPRVARVTQESIRAESTALTAEV